MKVRKCFAAILLLLLSVVVARAQECSTDIIRDFRADPEFVCADTLQNIIRVGKRNDRVEVHFKFDKYNLELDYMGNRASLQTFTHKIDSIGISKIDSVVIVSQSSPEGVYEHNLKLSKNRANTMRRYILSTHPELESLLRVYPDGESWRRLRDYVESDATMSSSAKRRVISVIDSDVNIGTKKWRMEQLPEYDYLLRTYYPRIRNSTFCIIYYSEITYPKAEPMFASEHTPMGLATESGVSSIVLAPLPHRSDLVSGGFGAATSKLLLKTNAIGLGMGIVNVAAEVDVVEHLSVTLPIYFSAWNYFKSTIKFRTFALQPELRYWPSKRNDGFFAGAHFGLAYYNFAFDGDYRYQDYGGTTPAVGGGLSIGYRLPISHDMRWRVEFSVGAGVYPLHYSIFHNTPNVKHGLMINSAKSCYFGIDQVAITFSYKFDIKKRGGRR